MDNIHYPMSAEEVSPEFRCIANWIHIVSSRNQFFQPYTPSLADIQYLVGNVIKHGNDKCLRLSNIILTVETGSYFGYLLNYSQINEIYIGSIDDGELALIRNVKGYMTYNFSECKMRFDRIECLANALNKSSVFLNFNNSDITVDGLKIILKVLKENLKESKRFDYELTWNQSFDIDQLGLDKLLACVDDLQFHVHNNDYDNNKIAIKNTFAEHSFVKVYVNHDKTGDFKNILNQNENKNWIVQVSEHKAECLLLMSMIDVMQELPMSFEINFSTKKFFGQKKLNEIMEGLVKTNWIGLKISISDLNGDDFDTIIDKIRNIKLERLSLNGMTMIDFNFYTIVKLLKFSGLQCLSINRCKLDYWVTKELLCQLKDSKLEKFSISDDDLSNIFHFRILESLIWSNLTSLELEYCKLNCYNIEIIAESLKNSNIKFIDLAGNKFTDVGGKWIAEVVGQTKLNCLILDANWLSTEIVIEILKSIQKTKITICCLNSHVKIEYEAVANILKDNKILLKCISKGKNDKIDEYLERNNNSFDKAKLVVDKFQKGTLSYHYKYKDYFEAYESFVDTDILWTNINDKEILKLKLKNNIKDNYLKICGIVNEKLEVNNENSENEKNISDLSPEIINKVCLNLNLSDVISG